jgi:hypothetical protein
MQIGNNLTNDVRQQQKSIQNDSGTLKKLKLYLKISQYTFVFSRILQLCRSKTLKKSQLYSSCIYKIRQASTLPKFKVALLQEAAKGTNKIG